MKDKGIPFPNLGVNILLEAPTLGTNNLFLRFFWPLQISLLCIMGRLEGLQGEGLWLLKITLNYEDILLPNYLYTSW